MESHTSHTQVENRGVRVPTTLWILTAALAAGLISVFVFNVPINIVFSIGLIGFMFYCHLFMHGGHGSHSSHAAENKNGPETDPNQENAHTTQGGCH